MGWPWLPPSGNVLTGSCFFIECCEPTDLTGNGLWVAIGAAGPPGSLSPCVRKEAARDHQFENTAPEELPAGVRVSLSSIGWTLSASMVAGVLGIRADSLVWDWWVAFGNRFAWWRVTDGGRVASCAFAW
jgi:hypothetical protein